MYTYDLAKLGIAAILLVCIAQPTFAGCGAAPTATNDQASALIQPILIDVLANDSEPSGMAMTIELLGGGTCSGTVVVEFGVVKFTPASTLLANCTIQYRVRNEENIASTPAEILVRNIPTLVFEDDFESGNADAWSDCGPSCP